MKYLIALEIFERKMKKKSEMFNVDVTQQTYSISIFQRHMPRTKKNHLKKDDFYKLCSVNLIAIIQRIYQ